MQNEICIRNAKLSDALEISRLINTYSEQGLMLSKSVESIIESIRNFVVAEFDGKIIGCCAFSFFSSELAEIRSLAVSDNLRGRGTGKMLVEKAEEIIKEEGIKSVFALTISEKFFGKLGYIKVEKSKFPQKIWRDCLGCPKIMQCDETAMEKIIYMIHQSKL